MSHPGSHPGSPAGSRPASGHHATHSRDAHREHQHPEHDRSKRSQPDGDAPVATDGKTVSIHYTGTLADGSVFDSSEGREPLTFTLGARQVIPGFENAIAGMRVGEKKTFTVPKEQAYPHHAEMVITMPRSHAPGGMALTQGMTLALKGPDGRVIPATLVKLDDETVTLDLNPAVAGKDLTFAVEVVRIV